MHLPGGWGGVNSAAHAYPPPALPEPLIRDTLLIGGGGFVGSVLRFALSTAVSSAWLGARGARDLTTGGILPLGTLAVNVIGCLVIGALGAYGQQVQPWSAGARLFLFTGLLGGFTTFSAFGYETFELARAGHVGTAAANVALQLLCGLAAVWCGYRLATAVGAAVGTAVSG